MLLIEAFAANDDEAGHTTSVEHSLNTGDALPIKEKLRRLPHHRRKFAEKHLENYLKLGIARKADPGKYPWASTIVLLN